MALDAPPEIRAAAGLDDDRVAAVREAMLAGRLDDAAALLPDSLVDHYAVAGDPDECTDRIAAVAASVDLFVAPDERRRRLRRRTSCAARRSSAPRRRSAVVSCSDGALSGIAA